MLSLGIEASLAFCTASASAGLPSTSPPPSLAATVIARASFVHSLPRRASTIAFLCLIPAHLECPAMRVRLSPAPALEAPERRVGLDDLGEVRLELGGVVEQPLAHREALLPPQLLHALGRAAAAVQPLPRDDRVLEREVDGLHPDVAEPVVVAPADP